MQRRDDTNRRWMIDDVPKMYRKILHKLIQKRDLECVLFLRMLMETGISPSDLWTINSSNIRGREIIMKSSKYGQEYRDLQGKYPKISKRTAKIAKAIFRRGLYFEKPYDYYKRKIRKCCDDSRFNVYLLRHYYIHSRSINVSKVAIAESA